MNKKYRILEIVSSALLVLAVVFIIIVITQIQSQGYVKIAGQSMFRVVTGSMEPTIKTGSLLICDEADIEEISVNDIICFKSVTPPMIGQVITHRVTDIKEINGQIRLTTKGDANTVEDVMYVTENNLIGKVTWYSHDKNVVAKVISFMSGKIGFLACIVFPILLVCGLALRSSMQNIQRELYELQRLEYDRAKKKQEASQQQESEEELIARLKAEIRKELGLDDEGTNE